MLQEHTRETKENCSGQTELHYRVSFPCAILDMPPFKECLGLWNMADILHCSWSLCTATLLYSVASRDNAASNNSVSMRHLILTPLNSVHQFIITSQLSAPLNPNTPECCASVNLTPLNSAHHLILTLLNSVHHLILIPSNSVHHLTPLNFVRHLILIPLNSMRLPIRTPLNSVHHCILTPELCAPLNPDTPELCASVNPDP